MRKGIIAVLSGLTLALGVSAPALASGHPVHPGLAGGNYQFEESNGNYYVGSFTTSAGNPVVESLSPRSFTFTVTTTYGGNNAGYIQFPNGNFLAATTNCDGATIKSSANSFGTVWEPKSAGSGQDDLINRGCDQNAGGQNSVAMAGRNNASQFTFCDMSIPHACDGLYHKMIPF